jgi:hypothetical protein
MTWNIIYSRADEKIQLGGAADLPLRTVQGGVKMFLSSTVKNDMVLVLSILSNGFFCMLQYYRLCSCSLESLTAIPRKLTKPLPKIGLAGP